MPPRASTKKQPKEEFVFEVLSANDLDPRETLMHMVCGPPKTGKSWLLGQMCEEGPTLLIAFLQREVSSVQYQIHNPDVILLEDTEWKPEPPGKNGEVKGTYNATAYSRFIELLELLQEDKIVSASGEPYRVVLIDSGTELAEAGWHEALQPMGVMDPAYLGPGENSFGPYTALDSLMDKALKGIQLLKTAPTPKYVGITWHVQPTKDDTVIRVGDRQSGYTKEKKSADHKGEGVEYEGSILPMVRGRFRRKVFGLVDAVTWTAVKHHTDKGSKKDELSGERVSTPVYLLQVRSDEERHCGLPGLLPEYPFIRNNWRELKALLQRKGE